LGPEAGRRSRRFAREVARGDEHQPVALCGRVVCRSPRPGLPARNEAAGGRICWNFSKDAQAMNTVIPRHLARPKEPGLVTVLRFSQDPLFGAARYFQTYGDTFTTRLFGQRMIMTRDPDWMSEVLVGKAQHFNKDKTTKGLSRFLGNGLLTSDGPT